MKRTAFLLLVLVGTLVGVAQAKTTYVLMAEDFEGLPLGPNVDEGVAGTAVWTDTPPAGWINDASGVPGVGDPATDGVTEWAGWGFANKAWWVQTAGDQRRSEFVLGQGTVAIADPDEWDDAAHPGPISANPYDVWLSTAPIDLSSARPGTVRLKFDSSWRPEYDDDYHQTANIRVSFDGAEPIEILRWESNSASPKFKNDSSTNETIIVDIPNPAGASSMVLTFGLFDAGNDWWWAIDNIVVTGEWSGIRASNPSPANGAQDVDARAVLSWTPGEYAGGSSPQHRILLGSDLDKVNDSAAVVATQDANSYDAAGQLDFATTYYWRVDEANSVTGWDEGSVWSFTTEPLAYPVTPIAATASSAQPDMGPQNTIDGSGLNANDEHSAEATEMWTTTGAKPAWIQFEFDRAYKLHELWVWNSNQLIEGFLGFGARDVAIEYSVDGAAWTALEGVPEFAKATGAAAYTANTKVNMASVIAKFVKLTINSNWGGVAPQTGLSEVRFFHIPVRAREPQPADGATDVSILANLRWRAGREAQSHEIYFGADPSAMTLVDTVAGPSYAPASMSFATTYFWKVDEIGGGGPYEGDLWSFTTQEYAPIDDFEGYNDDDNRIYDAWIDGLTTKASGSQVGYDVSPFAERTIIHGGRQAMPLKYDNSAAPFVSETERTFGTPQNWTLGGADTLSLYVRGHMPAFAETAAGGVLMNAIGADIWDTSDQFRYAYKSLNGNGTMIARVESLANSNAWAKAGVMIRQSVEPGSVHAFMALTPGGSSGGNGASFQRRPTAAGASSNNDSATVVAAPYWVKIERSGNNFSGFVSADGKTWTQLGTAQAIPMNGPVLIGLALCSHSPTAATGAEFSNVSFTGNVTGNWQVAEIGIAQPTGNSVEPLYVTLKDSSGKSKTVVNPDAAATARAGWVQWKIPLSEFTAAGVKLSAVKSMTIGVGDKAAPRAGGTGTLFIDDIGFGHPAP